MSKITNIPSEIRNFFSEKRRSIVMDTFTSLLEGLNLDNRSLGGLKRENCQLTNLQVFQILGAPDKPCGVGRADANPKLLLNDT